MCRQYTRAVHPRQPAPIHRARGQGDWPSSVERGSGSGTQLACEG
ncbi:hypothetical protein [Halomonas halophila]